MRRALLAWLACPTCRSEDLGLTVHRARSRRVLAATDADDEDILDGSLDCPSCGANYAIRQGIPRLLASDEAPPPQASAHRWTRFDPNVRQWEEAFLDSAQPLKPADFLGRLVLDVGCGFGRHAYFAARYGAEVVALDAGRDAVHAAQTNTADALRIHLVQGDLRRPPFRDGVFDIVYSYGVLHHLDDPYAALDLLHTLLRSGGRLSLWVYGPRQGLLSSVGDWMGRATAELEPEELHRLSRWVAYGLRAGSHAPYRLFHRVPLAKDIVTHLPGHDHFRWPFSVVVADVYDRLRVPVRSTFTGEELEAWFARQGYASIVVDRRVGNSESFRATALRR